MTKKNLIIMNKLRQELGSDTVRFLFTVKAQQITRINLSILRICLTDNKWRGIYISIDKPDKHVKMILERHNISREVSHVDTGTNLKQSPESISSPMRSPKKVLIVSGIFCPTLFLDSIDATMSSGSEAKERLMTELGAMDFLMVDNIATMAVYNSNTKIEEFFTRLDAFLKRFPNLKLFMSTDHNVPKPVYQQARRMVEREVEILEDWL